MWICHKFKKTLNNQESHGNKKVVFTELELHCRLQYNWCSLCVFLSSSRMQWFKHVLCWPSEEMRLSFTASLWRPIQTKIQQLRISFKICAIIYWYIIHCYWYLSLVQDIFSIIIDLMWVHALCKRCKCFLNCNTLCNNK